MTAHIRGCAAPHHWAATSRLTERLMLQGRRHIKLLRRLPQPCKHAQRRPLKYAFMWVHVGVMAYLAEQPAPTAPAGCMPALLGIADCSTASCTLFKLTVGNRVQNAVLQSAIASSGDSQLVASCSCPPPQNPNCTFHSRKRLAGGFGWTTPVWSSLLMPSMRLCAHRL